jgi:hypothetical protein
MQAVSHDDDDDDDDDDDGDDAPRLCCVSANLRLCFFLCMWLCAVCCVLVAPDCH